MEALLRPFSKIGVPSHEIAMMMTIALRFIPTFAEEADKIKKAQSARGADFASGSLVKRVKAMVPILVPLFISAFRRADELAAAMECRCYRGDVNRTRLKQLKTSKCDYFAIAVCVVCFVVVLILNRVGQIF
jgi:energy-coupling factor transport system permease protein